MNPITLTLKKAGLLCLVLSIHLHSLAGTLPDSKIFRLTNALNFTEVTFRLVNDLIIIPVKVNGSKELNFILDTGTSSPVILNSRYIRKLKLPLSRDVRFQGAGMGEEVRGKVIPKMSLQIADAYAEHIGGVVLDRNPLSNTMINGIRIHGIIGTSLFRSFAVEIDYLSQTLRLYERDDFLQLNTYSIHEMDLDYSRPILKTIVEFEGQQYPLRLMVDTGFNSELLIYDHSVINHKPIAFSEMGKGYSGTIKAAEARMKSLQLADRRIFDVRTYFPSPKTYKKAAETSPDQRDGIIGNALLKHFCVVLDYANSRFYLREHLLAEPPLAKKDTAER